MELKAQYAFVSETEAACSTHSMCVACLKLTKRTDNMKFYAQVTNVRALL